MLIEMNVYFRPSAVVPAARGPVVIVGGAGVQSGGDQHVQLRCQGQPPL